MNQCFWWDPKDMIFQVTVILCLKLWNVCPMPVNGEGVEVQEVQAHIEASLLSYEESFFLGKLDFSRTCSWIEGCVQIC